MLDHTVQNGIGAQLRATYEEMPKGGIPEVIWTLLLMIERKLDFGSAETLPGSPVLSTLAEWCRKSSSADISR